MQNQERAFAEVNFVRNYDRTYDTTAPAHQLQIVIEHPGLLSGLKAIGVKLPMSVIVADSFQNGKEGRCRVPRFYQKKKKKIKKLCNCCYCIIAKFQI